MFQFDNKISIPTILMVISSIAGGIWFTSSFFTQVQLLQKTLDERTTRLEIQQTEMARSLNRIEGFLQPRIADTMERQKPIKW